ncbi:hypothetical protein POVWA2_069400 [Plasmodium ovale wallikeri]|uniref:PIR Superfamily Protein n=1 Tax=Plasmodium ovale wallikeri TaxID=864142 RepID=A0A1A9AK94_PLAOA|nr:hypothetical protein POVWA2_069400 [Plasmodium ovale wallikeri]SBT57038.1 hypothetical protein POVWA1_079730 [Plasmodium ovale wallikeri]
MCQDTVISQNFVKENSSTLSDSLTVIYSLSNSESWKSILYYTSLGSSFRSFIIKQRKIRQYIDEKEQYNVLEVSPEGKECCPQNNDYNFSYYPVQI